VDNKLLLKPSEAGARLGLGRSKMYEMLASGELPSIRLGRAIRIPAKALDEWVERRMQAAQAK